MLLNATNLPPDKDKVRQLKPEDPAYAVTNGMSDFCFYWLAFATPFVVYGLNTPFLLLYT